MKTFVKNLAIVVAFVLMLSSCYKHNWETLHSGGQVAAPCILADTVRYSSDVAPIINASCGTSGSQATSCHGVGSTGGNYSDYSHFSNVTSPDSLNNVYLDITWAPTAPHNMPLSSSKLSQCDIDKIIRWMDQGSLNN
ncbi:MAG: hypothetical protein ABI388_02115 [Bacteroidia bacterium]